MATRGERAADKGLNEKHAKILKELMARPENRKCADCKKRDPRWASWNLGLFMCIRCSGIHRSIGVHVTKVKSADLDTWTPEQIQNMLRWGNAKANQYWEHELPPNMEPPEGAIEQWIRAKYERKQFAMKGPMPDPDTLPGDGTPPAKVDSPSASRSVLKPPLPDRKQTGNLISVGSPAQGTSFSKTSPMNDLLGSFNPSNTNSTSSQAAPKIDLKANIMSLYSGSTASSMPPLNNLYKSTSSSLGNISSSNPAPASAQTSFADFANFSSFNPPKPAAPPSSTPLSFGIDLGNPTAPVSGGAPTMNSGFSGYSSIAPSQTISTLPSNTVNLMDSHLSPKKPAAPSQSLTMDFANLSFTAEPAKASTPQNGLMNLGEFSSANTWSTPTPSAVEAPKPLFPSIPVELPKPVAVSSTIVPPLMGGNEWTKSPPLDPVKAEVNPAPLPQTSKPADVFSGFSDNAWAAKPAAPVESTQSSIPIPSTFSSLPISLPEPVVEQKALVDGAIKPTSSVAPLDMNPWSDFQ